MAEIPTYTIEDLSNLHLPGYESSATAEQILSADSEWRPILSASIFRLSPVDGGLETLTGVRRNSTTHDGVVSTPTMQMPKDSRNWAWRIVEYLDGRGYSIDVNHGPRDQLLMIDAPLTGSFATVARFGRNPDYLEIAMGGNLSYFTDKLLEYKLGLPNMVEANARRIKIGNVSLASLHIGFSAVGDNHDRFEPLAELAAAVMLTNEAASLLPSENEKYEYLGWTAASAFAENTRDKNVIGLAPSVGSAAVWFCAYGMCLKATSSVSDRSDLTEHLALSDPTMRHRLMPSGLVL